MKASALQEFLRSLGGSLSAVGVPPKPLDDLRSIASALEPFKDLSLEQFTDFLKRAAEFRHNGDVPVVAVPGLDDAMTSTRQLSEAVRSLSTADDSTAAEVELKVTQGKRDLQTALGKIAGEFGIGVKFTDDKKWLPGLRSKGAVSRVAEAIRHLMPQITGPESYQSEAVRSAITDLASTEAKVLKAVATELGVSGTGKGSKFVESLLARLTGIDGKPAKGGKKKADEPASDEQVIAVTNTLQEMVDRAKDPHAVSDSEIDVILARVSKEFSGAQQKAIAKEVTGKGGKTPQEAIDRLRADLTAVKRLLESQKV
jgi:hypothetical protein